MGAVAQSITSMSETLGERMKRARKAAGLTQEALAREVGSTSITISRYERNTIPDPSSTTIAAIAQRLGVSESWLLRGEEASPAPASPELDPPHWREFIDRYEHLGAFSAEQLLDIKRFAARNLRVKSWTDWERIAEMVRTSKPSPTFEKAKRGREDDG